MRANYTPIPSCELCGVEATLFCPSDSAFLCPSCDSNVHHANSLVSRHLRHPLCPTCHSISPSALCPTCSLPFSDADDASSSSSSSSSSCAVVRRRKRPSHQDAEAEAVFLIWCKRMGLESYAAAGIIPGASRVLELCRGRLKALPLRVAVAASFWLGMRRTMRMEGSGSGSGSSTWQRLKRVEEVSGVPAKLILAGEAKVVRAAQLQRVVRIDLREGWAECDVPPPS